ncbi:MAG: hypothetical protein WCF72_16470, partial [Pseudolabrys sp.]
STAGVSSRLCVGGCCHLANEVAYHKTVNGALENTLIPSASNADFKGLLQTGLKIFQGHQQHAEHVAVDVK